MDSLNEEWRTVPSFPEMEASSLGRVRRKPFFRPMPNGKIRAYVSKPSFGYRAKNTGLAGFRMILRVGGLGKTFKIARLVCEAFHGQAPEGKPLVLHGDDNPANNKPNNLSWGSSVDNLNAEQFINYCRSRVGEKNPNARSRQQC